VFAVSFGVHPKGLQKKKKTASKRETTPKPLPKSRHQNPFPRSNPETHLETHPESPHLGRENPDTRAKTHRETAPRSTPDTVRRDLPPRQAEEAPRWFHDVPRELPDISPIPIREAPRETADTVTEQAPIYSMKDLAGLNGKETK
jgi:hypothetical protein